MDATRYPIDPQTGFSISDELEYMEREAYRRETAALFAQAAQDGFFDADEHWGTDGFWER